MYQITTSHSEICLFPNELYKRLNVDSLEDFDVRVVVPLEVGVTAVSSYDVLLNSTLDGAPKLLLVLLLHVLSARGQHMFGNGKFVA